MFLTTGGEYHTNKQPPDMRTLNFKNYLDNFQSGIMNGLGS